MENNQRIEDPNIEEKRKEWIAKRRKAQVANQTLNLNTMIQRNIHSDPALVNLVEQVASTSGMPGLLKLQQILAGYITIVNNGGQM